MSEKKSEKNKEKKEIPTTSKGKTLERVCPKCGSIITSKILKQCPICDTVLEELPVDITPEKKDEEKSFLVFTGKKLELSSKFILQKDQWKFRESANIFFNSIVLFLFAKIGIFTLFFLLQGPSAGYELPITIEAITLNQIPGAFLIIYPLSYIFSKKHKILKLGLNYERRKLLIALLIGIIGTFLVNFVADLSFLINNFFVSIGWTVFAPPESLAEQYTIIKNSALLYKILISFFLMLDVFGTEITFRGVLHNGLITKLGSQLIERVYVILIVSLVYSGLFLFFTFDMGLVIIYFLNCIILGIIYEISNRNLFSTIFTNCIFTLITFIIILI